jgi:hypothetical protein
MTVIERRAWPRRSCPPRRAWCAARVRPGHDVQVLDLSCMGALIQGTTRLVPGSRVELRVGAIGSSLPIRGRIVRSYVSAIQRDVVFYRSAIAFDQPLELSAIEMSDGG